MVFGFVGAVIFTRVFFKKFVLRPQETTFATVFVHYLTQGSPDFGVIEAPQAIID